MLEWSAKPQGLQWRSRLKGQQVSVVGWPLLHNDLGHKACHGPAGGGGSRVLLVGGRKVLASVYKIGLPGQKLSSGKDRLDNPDPFSGK